MYYFAALNLFYLTVSTHGLKSNEYCNIKCGPDNELHTLCKYDCKPSSFCGNGKLLESNEKVREIFLDLHNKIRSELAMGHIENHPTAADMIELEYSMELEKIAGCYAATCTEYGAHDKCRNSLDGTYVGQNYFWMGYSGRFGEEYYDSEEFISKVITAWKDEYKHTPKDVIQSFRSSPNPKMPHGHWTQQIWSKTYKVGCARLYSIKDNQESVHVYCNYKEGGNFLGSRVYKAGKPCTNCFKCSQNYDGLCENQYNEEETERQQQREREEKLKQEQKRKQEQEEQEQKEKRKQEEQKREQEQKRKQYDKKEQERKREREQDELERRKIEWELEKKHLQDRERQWKLERERKKEHEQEIQRERERAQEREKEFEREREREREKLEQEQKRKQEEKKEYSDGSGEAIVTGKMVLIILLFFIVKCIE